MSWRERIVSDAHTLHGEVRVRGTRIPVSVVLDNLAVGLSQEEILASYPSLTEEDIRACLASAAALTRLNDAARAGAADAARPPGEGATLPEGKTLMDVLLSMPDVGEDADFERPLD